MYEDPASKFPDRSGPLSEVHEGYNLSTKSKMAINASVLPNAVEKQADTMLLTRYFFRQELCTSSFTTSASH